MTIDKMDNNENTQEIDYEIERPWILIKSYFKNRHLQQLVRHQTESYNNFISYQLEKTINMFNPVHVKSEHNFNKVHKKYDLELFIRFCNFGMARPQIHENNGATKLMFPNEARSRNFTYASSMSVDIDVQTVVRSGENFSEQIIHTPIKNVQIGKMPIMLRSKYCVLNQYSHVNNEISGECKMDPGGYFIISGAEKTCLGQERPAENQVYCFDISKNTTKYTHIAEIKSVPDWKCISPKQISIVISSKSNGFGHPLYIIIPRLKKPIPIFIMFRALGIITDKEICKLIVLDLTKSDRILSELKGSIVDANDIMTKESAMEYIINEVIYKPINMDKISGDKKKKEFALDVLSNDLFPHCNDPVLKIYFLGYMTHKLLKGYFKEIPLTDRDSYSNKRIDLTGVLLNNLFRNYFNKLVKDLQKQCIKEINNGSWRKKEDYANIINRTNIYKIVKAPTIENGIKRALATGDFGIKQMNSNKSGVAQIVGRQLYYSTLSHLRRINTPVDKSNKLVEPRKLRPSPCCPCETPEGPAVGLVKNLGCMKYISIPVNSSPLYEYVEPFITKLELNSDKTNLNKLVKVFVNGNWIGVSEDPMALYKNLKMQKSKGIVNIYTSIVFDFKNKEIKICNEAGRVLSPLIKVTNNKLNITNNICDKVRNGKISWEDLTLDFVTGDSIIEYLDSAELENTMIAMTPKKLTEQTHTIYKYTHCEIHPSLMFGILASCIPFPEHNQSPRNCYQSAMGKQAIGIYATNYPNRMDKTSYMLNNTTRPLVDTRIMDIFGLNKIPAGNNAIIAIMSSFGYNQEDSLHANEGSIDRGLFSATIFHTEKDEDKKIHGEEEIRCKPDESITRGMKFGNYSKVNTLGVIPENALVENRDIIISKIAPIKDARNDHTKPIKYEDQSRIYRTHEECYVDKNYIDTNGDGYNFAKVRIRTYRKPVVGDKFSSRHGQKGTIGKIIPEKDMPMTSNGIRPDIMINPHAIPSRMTIGQLKETLLGKVLVELGVFGDGTSFMEHGVPDISKKLQELGYCSNGYEILYDGQTGKQIETEIFIGPTFYQRLKHMVKDKQHSRSIGPMVNLTRQPAEGRSRDGGLRFGEMERDCICLSTPLSLNIQNTVQLKYMEKNNYEVLSYNENKNITLPDKQLNFMHKGTKECVELTLEDGRKLRGTPDHKVLNNNGDWVAMSETEGQLLKVGITYPLLDVGKNIEDCNGWMLQKEWDVFKTDTPQEYMKTMTFMKILGYGIMDGNIRYDGKQMTIHAGHHIDAKMIVNDLKIITGIDHKYTECTRDKKGYDIYVVSCFAQYIASMNGVIYGAKIKQSGLWPEFVIKDDFPVPLLKEFLGGVYGADGHTNKLYKRRGRVDLGKGIGFSRSNVDEHFGSLETSMEQLKTMLNRCGIKDVTIQNIKETTSSKKTNILKDKKYQIVTHIAASELSNFHKYIGFKYCCHKAQRLEASAAYQNKCNKIIEQRNWIYNRVNELTNYVENKKINKKYRISTTKAIEQAFNELSNEEGIFHECVKPDQHDVSDHFMKGCKYQLKSGNIEKCDTFMQRIGAYEWFKDDKIDRINYGVNEGSSVMHLKVISVKPAGHHPVCDIEVKKNHNFLANGVVAHNCMISHGASRFTKERLYDASDAFQVYVCKCCGMIAAYNEDKHIHHCKTCDNRTDFSYVELPYACKLLFQELITMNIAPRIMT